MRSNRLFYRDSLSHNFSILLNHLVPLSICSTGLLLLTVPVSCMAMSGSRMDLQLLTVLGCITVLLPRLLLFAPTAAANDTKAREGAGKEEYTCHGYHVPDQVFVGPGEV